MNLYRVTWQMSAYIDAESEELAIKHAKDGDCDDTEFLLIDAEVLP